MKKEMSENEARYKAEAYCSMAEHCRAEVMEKLYQWGVSSEWMEGILNHLEQEGYIDQVRYAKAFVRDKYRFNQWGRIKIAQSLRQNWLRRILLWRWKKLMRRSTLRSWNICLQKSCRVSKPRMLMNAMAN